MKIKTLKILIFGKNEDSFAELKDLIRNLWPDNKIITVMDEYTGCELAAVENPDIIFLADNLNVTDSIEVCRKLKAEKKTSSIPIVFLTGTYTDKATRKLALEGGVDAFLSSPIDESELVLQLRTMVKIKNARFVKHEKKEPADNGIEDQYQKPQFKLSSTQEMIEFIQKDNEARKLNDRGYSDWDQQMSKKIQRILVPGGSIADLELSDIIDAVSIQNMMENFYELSQIPMAIIDTNGNILVGVGWQDICTKFHRINPDSCTNCIESDVYLTQGIPEGEFRLYKCKNNMWDIATPIIIGNEHKGNLFLGQFFFDSEPDNEELFVGQARRYNFPVKEYLDAVERAPRISKKTLDQAKAFLLNLSRSISHLSYSNILLAKAITQQKKIEDALRYSEELLNKAQEIAHLGSWSLDLITNTLTWSDELYNIFGLKPNEFAATYEGFIDAVHPEDREMVNSAYTNSIQEGKDSYRVEHRIIRKRTGELRYVLEKCEHFKNKSGKIVRSVGMTHDITARKVEEARLIKLNKTLAALSKSSQAMSQFVEENDYLRQVCKIIVEDTDFTMVWIGYARDDEAKTVEPVASAGFDKDYLSSIRVTWDDSKTGRGPTGTAIRTGKMCMCNNMFTDPDFIPWREQAIKRGYAASIVFPLKTGEKTIGAISIYSAAPDSFLEDEINLLTELANDLAHGINTIRLRTAHKKAEEALSESHSRLELLVKERTRELQITNELLQKEINIGKQQEIDLKLAEEKYRTVADHTHGWEFWLDKDENFLYCSPSCERITGYKATDFLQKPQLLYEIIHPDDIKAFRSHRKTKELGQAKENELEYRIIHKDGSVRWIGHECQPINDELGNYKGTRGSNKDITGRKDVEQQLKTSNQKYRLLSANITDGIFICRHGRLEYVNKAMKRIFGYTKYKMEGIMLSHLALPEYKEELNQILHLNSPGNQLRNIEIDCLKKDHTIIHVEILLNYVAREKVIYGVLHDITDKKQIQKNIVKAIIMTEEKEKAHFSKELHDGLGPLLSAIKLYLQWSERPNSQNSRVEIIHKAEDILEEALTTVKEISNKLSPHLLNYYGLTSAIQSFVDKLEETSTIKINFESNVTIRLGNEIEAAFYRAVIECLNNTMKYAKARNANIILDYTGDQLQLLYTDDGIGFNLEETLAVKKGLGLYNLQNRIQTIGGKIVMFSSPGKGVNYQIDVKL
ncbi:MAG TPA: PocR ligand-binding domain-containing protein [Prolixibacteraceae bacterium]|nr:PocR ligand-binding domain-containing protein [Prolixibacteraceae bacterium]